MSYCSPSVGNNETGKFHGLAKEAPQIKCRAVVALTVDYNMKIFHNGRLFELKIMQNTETVKKLRNFENKHSLITQKGSVHGKSHFYGRRASMRQIFHPNMSLIGFVLQEL